MEHRPEYEMEMYSDNSPPWEGDDLIRHVDSLERQLKQMQSEIHDLRSMLNDNPAEREFSVSQRDRLDSTRFRDGYRSRPSDRDQDEFNY